MMGVRGQASSRPLSELCTKAAGCRVTIIITTGTQLCSAKSRSGVDCAFWTCYVPLLLADLLFCGSQPTESSHPKDDRKPDVAALRSVGFNQSLSAPNY